MPYINQEDRVRILGGGSGVVPTNPGELNYMLTLLIKRFLGKDYNYQKLNDAIGALECCKLELYRRVVTPYENSKIAQNGDVF